MAESRNPNLVWEKVLQRILPSMAFKVAQHGNELKVRVDKKVATEAAKKLSLAFSQPISLPYQTIPASSTPSTLFSNVAAITETKTIEFPTGNYKRQINILEKLISKDPRLAVAPPISHLFTRCIDDSLATESTTDVDTLRVYSSFRPIFNKALAKLTPEQINQAFEGKQTLATQKSAPIGDATKHCATVGNIPGAKSHDQQLLINLKTLYTLANALPVNSKEIENKQDEIELTISTTSFLLKLKQLLSDQGEMLISKQGEAIFFGIRDFIKPHMLSFVLDRSASMGDHFPELKKQVIHFIDVLKKRKLDYPVDVRVTFFAEATDDVKEFSNIYNNDDALKELEDYVSAEHKLGDGTCLNMSVIRELEEIKTQQLTKEKHVTMILFTDGADNLNKEKAAEIKTVIDSFKDENDSTPLPTGFVLALGREENLDFDILRTISKSLSRTEPMLLNDAKDFTSEIIQHIELIELSSERKKIGWLVDGQEKEAIFDLLHNNTAQIAPGVQLPTTGSYKVSIDDKPAMTVDFNPTKLSSNNLWSKSSQIVPRITPPTPEKESEKCRIS